MKKLILFMFIALAFTACKKIDEDNAKPSEVEVSFTVSEDDEGLKFQPAECPEDGNGNVLEPATAEIEIKWESDPVTNDSTTEIFTPIVFRVDGILYTQSLKLKVPESGTRTYRVTKFLLKAQDGRIIRATPVDGAEYSEFVSKPVPFDFNVTAFEKADISVEVLCFQPEVYTWFGFNWFGITELEIREKCFFGDICLNGEPYTPYDFEGSAYGTGLGIDVPAIMKIFVRLNGNEVPNSPFTNFGGDLTTPLCVQYPDNLNVDEEFTFELQLWLPDEDGIFSWQIYETYVATNDGDLNIDTDADNVLDFVVGTCGYLDMADQVFDFINDDPVTGLGSQTAYAYTDIASIACGCFPDLGFGNNWGWQIGAFSGDQTFELWAAAGGCDLGNGTEVGELLVNFDNDGKLVDVEYAMNSPYTLEEVQLYISKLPWSGNNIAPGQFPYKVDGLGGVTSYIFSDTDLPDLTSDVYVIAHAVVSGF